MCGEVALMAYDQNLRLPPNLPSKAETSAEPWHEVPQEVGAPSCTICRKEPAEVGGLCVDCDHLQGDIQIDQTNQER